MHLNAFRDILNLIDRIHILGCSENHWPSGRTFREEECRSECEKREYFSYSLNFRVFIDFPVNII